MSLQGIWQSVKSWGARLWASRKVQHEVKEELENAADALRDGVQAALAVAVAHPTLAGVKSAVAHGAAVAVAEEIKNVREDHHPHPPAAAK